MTTSRHPIYEAIRRVLMASPRCSWDRIEVHAQYDNLKLTLFAACWQDTVTEPVEHLAATSRLTSYFRDLRALMDDGKHPVQRIHYVLHADGEHETALNL